MIDSDDVLLLRPLDGGFPLPPSRGTELPQSRFLATLHFADAPFETFPPTELPPLASFTTEYAENTFPALPVREGEHAFVLVRPLRRPGRAGQARGRPRPATTVLELAPTARSLLR